MPRGDFKPGDVIIKTYYASGRQRRWIVQDPPRTRAGKLRVRSERATAVSTTWWTPDSLPRWSSRWEFTWIPREVADGHPESRE